MGGDHAPVEVVRGALLAAQDSRLKLLLVGQEDAVRAAMAKARLPREKLQIETIGASEVIEMGESPAQAVGIREPRVGLLSNGEEAGKGNEQIRAAHALLKESSLRFIGNVEGRDLFRGHVDVVVCDGFVGNVVLKVGEGVVELLMTMVK